VAALMRACLRIEWGPAARLLALAGVGSAIAARGDAQASPPWPPPKSTAAGPLSIFRLAPRPSRRFNAQARCQAGSGRDDENPGSGAAGKGGSGGRETT